MLVVCWFQLMLNLFVLALFFSMPCFLINCSGPLNVFFELIFWNYLNEFIKILKLCFLKRSQMFQFKSICNVAHESLNIVFKISSQTVKSLLSIWPIQTGWIINHTFWSHQTLPPGIVCHFRLSGIVYQFWLCWHHIIPQQAFAPIRLAAPLVVPAVQGSSAFDEKTKTNGNDEYQ